MTAPSTPLRAAIYARVSTEDQAERQTVQAQLDFLRRFCDLHQIPVAGEYVDDGISGATEIGSRPQGRRLLDEACAGKFAVVLVYRLDRLGRSLKALLTAHDALDAANVAIRSATEPFDTTSPIGRFLFQLLGSIAELERESIRERTTMGRVRVAKAGQYAGGPVAFGYELDAEKRLTPSTRMVAGVGMTEANIARDLFARIAGGSTLHVEAERMNALGVPSFKRYGNGKELVLTTRWSAARVWAIIHNPVYRGTGVYRTKMGTATYEAPPLVDEATWEKAQAVLTRNRLHASRNAKHTYLLRRLVTCAACGMKFTGIPGKPRLSGPTRWYRCNGKFDPGVRCPSKALDADAVESEVWASCRAFIMEPGSELADAQRQLRERMEQTAGYDELRRAAIVQLAEKDAERERVLTLYRRGTIDITQAEAQLAAISHETAVLREEMEALRAQEALVTAQEAQLTDAVSMLLRLQSQIAEIEATDDRAMKQQIIEMLVAGVTVTTEGRGRGASSVARVRYTFAARRDEVVLGIP